MKHALEDMERRINAQMTAQENHLTEPRDMRTELSPGFEASSAGQVLRVRFV